MKRGIAKTHSSYQMDVNRMRERCTALQETIRQRKEYHNQTKRFISDMLAQGKISKEDLKPYFKRKKTVNS